MNVERVNLLVSELKRLDPSVQCRGYLKIGDEMCVEGVACEVYRQQARDGRWIKSGPALISSGIVYAFAAGGYSDTCAMPPVVRDWYGFEDADFADGADEHRALVTMNDGLNFDFRRIAAELLEAAASDSKIYA